MYLTVLFAYLPDTRRIGGLETNQRRRVPPQQDTRRIGGLESHANGDTIHALDTRRIGGLENMSVHSSCLM